MKKGKIGAVNSYSQYKRKKVRQEEYIVLLLGIAILLGVSFFTGKGSSDWKEIIKWVNRTPEPVEQGVYLSSPRICYELYNAPKTAKGIYVPAKKLNNYKEFIKLAKETEVNSFVIDVKNDGGFLTFETDNEDLISKGVVLASPPIQNIKEIMSALYENNIYPIARVVAFKDNVITKREPERAIKNLKGEVYTTSGGDRWLNPYDRENWEYLLEVSREAVKMGFKEIQFDYVRFHESMNESRVVLEPDKSKVDIITEFVAYICEKLQAEGVKVSADVFGAVVLSDIDANIVGQDFVAMSQYLDYICPMVYPSHYADGTFGIQHPNIDPYHIILKTMNMGVSKIEGIQEGKKAVIRPWLQDFTMSSLKPYLEYGPDEIRAQIQGAQDAGVDEWLFWNASGIYTKEGLKAE